MCEAAGHERRVFSETELQPILYANDGTIRIWFDCRPSLINSTDVQSCTVKSESRQSANGHARPFCYAPLSAVERLLAGR